MSVALENPLETMPSRRRTGAAQLREHVTDAIWRAAIIELGRVGYARLSMESVARRAGVGKAALYRRWPGKEAMIIALMSDGAPMVIAAPDTGSLRGDLYTYLNQAMTLLRRPIARRILPDLYAELSRDTQLALAIRSTVQARKRESAMSIIHRAIERGELSPGIDRELAFDTMMGPIYWRMFITRSPTDAEYLEHLTRLTLAILTTLSEQSALFG